LSYTTYKYGNLTIRADDKQAGSYTVSFDVMNTGNRAGKEVAQVYVGEPHARVRRPAKELKGFAKVELQPGETKTVAIPLNARAFSYYDTANKRWQADAAQFEISVGSSSAGIALRDRITLKRR
jgi:beta-glucosidase